MVKVKLQSAFFTAHALSDLEARVVRDILSGLQHREIASKGGVPFPDVAELIQSARDKAGVPTVVGNHAPRILLAHALEGGLELEVDVYDAERVVRLSGKEKDILMHVAHGRQSSEMLARPGGVAGITTQFKLNKAFGSIQNAVSARHIVYAALKYAATRRALKPEEDLWPNTHATITNE